MWNRWRRRRADASHHDAPTSPPEGPPEGPQDAPEAPAPRPPGRPLPAQGRGATLDGTDPDTVRPVTRDRVAASLRRRGYRYLVDEGGDLCGLWAYRFFSFYLIRDQVLQIRGRWSRQASIERLWEVLDFTNAWNREHHHPKVYVRVNDDGRVHVLTEVSLPVTSGLSDTQLDHHLTVGLLGGALVFDELDERYPDPVLRGEP